MENLLYEVESVRRFTGVSSDVVWRGTSSGTASSKRSTAISRNEA